MLGAPPAHADQGPIDCITCHQALGGALAKPITDWRGSIHFHNSIACAQCHGGNPNVAVGNVLQLTGPQFMAIKSSAMSTAQGFIGKPSGGELFAMCAKCHPSSVARYQGSIMGKAYLANKGGPSCLVCHHAHRNVIPEVPKVCSKCHKDTSGFTQIDPMNVTKAAIVKLSKIRIRLVSQKTEGTRPTLAPRFSGEMSSYQVGLLAFGAIIFLFLLAYGVYVILERGDEK
jgi:Zn finger protein HypA/HybF involved in hydrogenase expression